MKVPYKEIAFHALTKWNKFDEKEATKMINLLNVDELDTYIHAKKHVNSVFDSIAKNLHLTDNDKKSLMEAVYFGPIDHPIFKKIENMLAITPEKELLILSILADIHDEWVKSNANDKAFNEKAANKLLRQYVPLPLLGYNEVKKDLVFLKPILTACGLDTDKLKLEAAFHDRLFVFLLLHKIYKTKDLEAAISAGSKFYPALSPELENKLKPLAHDVFEQIWSNWEDNDKSSEIMFLSAEKAKLMQERQFSPKK